MHSYNDQLAFVPGDNAGHAFDLNDPQEEQDNLHIGDYFPQFPVMFATIIIHCKKFHNLFIEEHHLHFFVGDDNIALQEEQDTLDDVIHDFGMYTHAVDILFDEELSDSDDEDYQQPLRRSNKYAQEFDTKAKARHISRFASVKH
jgi:hypothetical protein